jgi:uncharacterized protein YndB with AHSA1/START domain
VTSAGRIPGDEVVVSVLVEVDRPTAFRVFTEEIDQWWKTGFKYRVAGREPSVVHLEPRVGGRLYESYADAAGPKVVASGDVTVWEPPERLTFAWRAVNFAEGEATEVEVTFTEAPSGTTVTIKHRGWSGIRPDHPARHGHDVPGFIRMMGLWWAELATSLRLHVGRD